MCLIISMKHKRERGQRNKKPVTEDDSKDVSRQGHRAKHQVDPPGDTDKNIEGIDVFLI